MESLSGKDVVVTGGAGALGAAVVRCLAQEGARCHVPLRPQDPGAGLADLGADRVRIVRDVDPLREEDMSRLHAALPGLWASVHCIGGYFGAPLDSTSMSDVTRLFESNVYSSWILARSAVHRMRERGGGGRIVLTAARVGLEPRSGSGMAAYAASKAAVAAMTAALGEELADEGILVNAVAPSLMDTPANRAAMPGADVSRWPRTEDVARTIAWLCSPGQVLVRGAVVPVYGRS